MEILKVNSLAYLDSFLGLISVKVLEISPKYIKYIVTDTYKAYKKGDIDISNHRGVVPRKSIRYNEFGIGYIRPYQVEINNA